LAFINIPMHAFPLSFWHFTLQSNQHAATEILAAAGGDNNMHLAARAYSRAARWVESQKDQHPEYGHRVGEIARDLAFVLSLPVRLRALVAQQQTQSNPAQAQQLITELHARMQQYQAADWRRPPPPALPAATPRAVRPQPASTPRSSAIELPSSEHKRLAQEFGLTVEQVVETHRAIQKTPYSLREVLLQVGEGRFTNEVSEWRTTGRYASAQTLSLARNNILGLGDGLSDRGFGSRAGYEQWVLEKWDFANKTGAHPWVAAQFEQIEKILDPTCIDPCQREFFHESNLELTLPQAIFLAQNRMLTPQARVAPNLQDIEARLKAALQNGHPHVAELPLQLNDGRVVHLTAYLDERGQLQLAEKLRLEPDAPHQGAYPLLQTRKGDYLHSPQGEFLYPRKLGSRWEMLTLQASLPTQGLTYQLFPVTAADQAVRHATSFADLKQQLGHQVSFSEEEAQVWTVDLKGQPLRFRVYQGLVSDLNPSVRSQQTQLLTDPPMSAAQLAGLRNMRYEVVPISRPVRAEPTARIPVELEGDPRRFPGPHQPINTVQLGEAYALWGQRPLTLVDIEAAAKRYFTESGLADKGQALRFNVQAGKGDHFQLHLKAQLRPEGPGWTVGVEYLDKDGRRLTEDQHRGWALPSTQRADGVALSSQTWPSALVELHLVPRNGTLPQALYHHPVIDGNRPAVRDRPPVLTPNERAVAKGKEAMAWALPRVEVEAFLYPSQASSFEAIKADSVYLLGFYGPTAFEDAITQAKRLHDAWAAKAPLSNNQLTQALTVTLSTLQRDDHGGEFFQIRVWVSKNAAGEATHQVQLLDLKGQPLPVDYLKRPYLVCSDGKMVLLDTLLLNKDLGATFSFVRLLPSEVAAGSAQPRQVAVQKLDINSGEATSVSIDSTKLKLGKHWRMQNGRWLNSHASSYVIQCAVGFAGERDGQALIANVAVRSKEGEVFHLLVKIKNSKGKFWPVVGEPLDLYGQPLPTEVVDGSTYTNVIRPDNASLKPVPLITIKWTELVVEYHVDPNP
jgi:hypothetical protein